MAVAKDEKRSNDDRRKAVLLLGKIGSPECLEFLIANVTMRVMVAEIAHDRDMDLLNPCKYALSDGDWNVPRAIVQSLHKPKTKQEMIYLLGGMTLPTSGFGPEMAHALVQQELRNRRGDPVFRENLLTMRDLVVNSYGKAPPPVE